MYKIFAAILQARLADKIDTHLQKTQYGFRKRKAQLRQYTLSEE
jgi:hypothetical protein